MSKLKDLTEMDRLYIRFGTLVVRFLLFISGMLFVLSCFKQSPWWSFLIPIIFVVIFSPVSAFFYVKTQIRLKNKAITMNNKQYFTQLAKLFNMELNVEFKMKGFENYVYKFTENGVMIRDENSPEFVESMLSVCRFTPDLIIR